MEKKLPGVFATRIEKKISNNESMHYTSATQDSDKETRKVKESTSIIDNRVEFPKKEIKEKINQIFNSTEYIYKADVEITTKDKKINKRIIGRNNHNLITIDNELIQISEIVDIKIVKE